MDVTFVLFSEVMVALKSTSETSPHCTCMYQLIYLQYYPITVEPAMSGSGDEELVFPGLGIGVYLISGDI